MSKPSAGSLKDFQRDAPARSQPGSLRSQASHAKSEAPISTVGTELDSEVAGGMYSRTQLLRGYMLLDIGQVTILSTLKVKDVLFAFLANAIGMYNVCFSASFIAIHLHRRYQVSDAAMGNYFLV